MEYVTEFLHIFSGKWITRNTGSHVLKYSKFIGKYCSEHPEIAWKFLLYYVIYVSTTTECQSAKFNIYQQLKKKKERNIIFFCKEILMATHTSKYSDTIIFLSNERDSSLGKPYKRLQLVFRAIYFVTFLIKKRIARNTLVFSQLLRDSPYVIDIESINDHEKQLFHGINKEALAKLVRERDFDRLLQFGGVRQVVVILGSDLKEGIRMNENELKQRKVTFGSNIYDKPPAKSFLSFLVEGFKDTTIIILLVCAVLSLGFGIKQHGPKEGWYDGGSIIVAIILVLAVSSISNFKQSRQFLKLSEESKDIKVEVVRDGRRQEVSIFDIVVGDVVCLKIGDHIPADGLFLDGHSLQVDESSMTG